MKSLFNAVSSIVSGSSESSKNLSNSGQNSESTTPKKTLRSRFGRSSRQATPQAIDRAHTIINDAANSLSQILQDILSSDLNNDANFQRLILVLEGDMEQEAEEGLPFEEGQVMSLLLENIDHPKFVELCSQVNLASGLFQALRLLRMIEMKHAKGGIHFMGELAIDSDQGITVKAAQNVCSLFEKLCSSPTTIEQIRQILVKLLTFPLSPSPVLAQHLQHESVKVIRAICKAGFNSQQIWFLHEVQAMMHIVRTLSELVGSLQSGNVNVSMRQSITMEEEIVLKGRSAEAAGMWVEAVECLVEILLASLQINSVLLTDFEEAKGFSLLMTILRHTSSERFLKILNVISMLIFDPNCKKDENSTIPFTHLGNYLSEYLLEAISWPENGVWNYDPAILYGIAVTMTEDAGIIHSQEYVIQGFAYTILKLFSMEPISCAQLEDQFHFLGALILTIPSLEPQDVVTAILTVVNYVFQCVESCSTRLISALCASAAVLIHQSLAVDTIPLPRRILCLNHAELLFVSMEAVSRSNIKYVLLFLNTGLLKLVARDSLEKLHQQLFPTTTIQQSLRASGYGQHPILILPSQDQVVINPHSLVTYKRIVQLITDLNALNQYAAEEVRNNGIILLLRRIIVAPEISVELTRSFLRLTEDISQVDTTYLLESLVALYLLVREVRGFYRKTAVMFESLWKILIRNEDWSHYHVQEGGLETSFEVMRDMKLLFVNSSTNYTETLMAAFECLQAISRYMSLLVFHASEVIEDAQYVARFAWYFLQTGVFESDSLFRVPALQLLMDFLHVFAVEEGFIQFSVAEIVIEILSRMSSSALESFVTLLAAQVLRYNAKQRAFLVESGVPAALLKLCPLYTSPGKLSDYGKDLLAITKHVTQSYMSSRMLMAQIKGFIKPLLMDASIQKQFMYRSMVQGITVDEETNQDDRDPRYSDKASAIVTGSDVTTSFLTLEDIFDLQNMTDASPVGDGPYFIIPVSNNQDKVIDSTSLGIFFSPATTPLPANCLTLSLWFRIADLTEAKPYSQENRVVPIISIESADLGEELVIELNLDSRVVIVACNGDKVGRKSEQLAYKHSMDVDITQWTHMAVVIRRTKKLMESNSLLFTIYMNGIQWPSVDPQSRGLAANNNQFFTNEQSGEIRVGYERMNSLSSDSSAMIPPDLSIHLSSLAIFNEALQSRHISIIYIRGVSYQGLHTRRCKMTQEPVIFASRALCVANHTSKNALLYLDKTDLRNVYLVVDRYNEDHQYVLRDYDISELPQAMMIVSAVVAVKERLSYSMNKDTGESTAVALRARASSIRYLLYDLAHLDNLIPIATLGSAGGKVDHMSFGFALESIGGVASWLPLLFIPPSMQVPNLPRGYQEQWIQGVLHCMTSLNRQSVWAQSYLHFAGYRLLAFALYEQYHSLIGCDDQSPSSLFYGNLLRLLLQASVDRASHTNRSNSVFVNSSPSKSTGSTNNNKESLLLIETSVIRHIALNHALWNVRNVDYVLEVLSFLDQVANDAKFGSINAMRLSVLGTPRWTLYLCLTLALNGERMLSKVNVFEIADHREEVEDVLLTPAMSLLQGMLSTDMRSRDLELIAAMISSTFYPPANTATNVDQPNMQTQEDVNINTDKIDEEETASINHPFCTYIHEKSSIDHEDYRYMRPLEKLRVYLLRLLSRVYEDQLEEIRRNSIPRTNTTGGATGANSSSVSSGNNNAAGNPTASSKLSGSAGNTGNNTNVNNELLQVQRFREVFNVSWFLTILEQDLDVATLSCLLRLLGLLLQKDAVFSFDFAQARGVHVLGHVLRQRNQEIPIILPLISILFRIPMQMTLHPFQVKNTSKVAQMLELDECAGPILSEDFLQDLTIPLLHIYYSSLVQAAKLNVSKAPWARQSEGLLLQTLIFAFENNQDFKRLLQHRLSMEIHVTAMLSCSNAYQEYGAHIYQGDSLDAFVQEEYISPMGVILEDSSETSEDSEVTMLNSAARDSQQQAQRKQANRQYSMRKQGVLHNNPRMQSNNNNFDTSFDDSGYTQSDMSFTFSAENNSSSQINKDDEEIPDDQPIIFMEDIGQSLRDLLRNIIQFGFQRDADNNKILLNLFVAYSTAHFSRSCERQYQKWICDSVRRVMFDVLSQPSLDLQVVLCYAKNIHSLTMLLKGFFLYDTTVFSLLQCSVEILQMMYAMPNTSGIIVVSGPDKQQLVMKELVLNVRLLLVTALSYGGTGVLGGNSAQVTTFSQLLYKGNKVERKALLEFVRKRMELIFLPLVDDVIEPLTSLSSRLLATATSAVTSSTSSTSTAANINNAGTMQVSAADFMLDSAAGGRRLSTAGPQGNTSLQPLLQGKNDRAKISAVFWAFLVSHCYWICVDEELTVSSSGTTPVNSAVEVKKIRQEAALILTYLVNHRRKLLETLCSDSAAFSRQWRTAEDVGSSGADFFHDGLIRLVSTHHHSVSPTASLHSPSTSSNGINEMVELSISDFFYWIHQHQEKCDRIFRALDNVLYASHGNAMPISNFLQDMEDCHRVIARLRRVKDDVSTVLERADHVRNVLVRKDQAWRLSERVWRSWKSWFLEPIRDMAVGALLYRKVKQWILTGNVWGCAANQQQGRNNSSALWSSRSKKPSNSKRSTMVSQASSISLSPMSKAVKLRLDLSASINSNASAVTPSSPYQKIDIPNINSFDDSQHRAGSISSHDPMSMSVDPSTSHQQSSEGLLLPWRKELFLQPLFMWRVNYREGPERTRRLLYQDFSKSTQDLVHYNEQLRYVMQLQQQQILLHAASGSSNHNSVAIAVLDPQASDASSVSPAIQRFSNDREDDMIGPSVSTTPPRRYSRSGLINPLTSIREEETANTTSSAKSNKEEDVGTILRNLKLQGILRKQSKRNVIEDDNDVSNKALKDEDEDNNQEEVGEEADNNEENDNDNDEIIAEDDPNALLETGAVVTHLTRTSQMRTAGGSDHRQLHALSPPIDNDDNTNINEASNSEKMTGMGRHRLFSTEGDGYNLPTTHSTANNAPLNNTLPGTDSTTGSSTLNAAILLNLREQEQWKIDMMRHVRSQMLKEMIRGLIPTADLRMAKLYNIDRIFGLEAQPGVLFHCKEQWYFLLGMSFIPLTSRLVNGTGAGKKNVQPVSHSHAFSDVLFTWRFSNSVHASTDGVSTSAHGKEEPAWWYELSDDAWLQRVWQEFYELDTPFVRFHIAEIYSFFHRRHQLKYTGLEIADRHGLCMLFACQTVPASQELLTFLIDADIPGSIYAKFLGMKNLQMLRGSAFTKAYPRLLHHFVSALTQLWQHHEITNFEYLMYINAAAGRSYMDLTQYPVFPWVLANYSSTELDLSDPDTFRDLSKPMGALSEKRRMQYLERYTTMNEFYFGEDLEGASPPFHYGTHYSCAGYVLHYLLRLQPYTHMSLALQGGTFDKADRLFYHIENSWLSASRENLQDVRELIPEFYYLPDFLVNRNQLQLGITQKNEVISDVVLPAWVPNQDPKEFIRLHRMALESKYVSEHLHLWMDLIFGVKQLGPKAVDAMNVFIHITYEGEVDLDAIDDELAKTATLAQINNFGQTPSQVFVHKEHPRKIVPEVVRKLQYSNNNSTSGSSGNNSNGNNPGGNSGNQNSSGTNASSEGDFVVFEPSAISAYAYVTPPLSVIGIPQYHVLTRVSYQQMVTQGYGAQQRGVPVGDIRFIGKEKLIACAQGSLFVPPLARRIVKYRTLLDGLVIQNLHSNVAARALESEKDITYHDQLHLQRITIAAFNRQGDLLATGSEDASVRLWQILRHQHDRVVENMGQFTGHEGKIVCLDVCSEYHLLISGSSDRRVGIWDYHQHTLVRMLPKHLGVPVGVSMNPISGLLVTLTKYQLRVYHSNGEIVSYFNFHQPALSLLPAGSTSLPTSASLNFPHVSSGGGNVGDRSKKAQQPPQPQWQWHAQAGQRLTLATSVCAVPCGDWQEDAGVVCVTGHQEGHVYLWKLRAQATAVLQPPNPSSGSGVGDIGDGGGFSRHGSYWHSQTSPGTVQAAANRGDFSPISLASSSGASTLSSAVSTPMNPSFPPSAVSPLRSVPSTPLRTAINNNGGNNNPTSGNVPHQSSSRVFFNAQFSAANHPPPMPMPMPASERAQEPMEEADDATAAAAAVSNNRSSYAPEDFGCFDEAFYPIPLHRPFRGLTICATPAKTHRADISVLRVLSTQLPTHSIGNTASTSASTGIAAVGSSGSGASTSNTTSNATSSHAGSGPNVSVSSVASAVSGSSASVGLLSPSSASALASPSSLTASSFGGGGGGSGSGGGISSGGVVGGVNGGVSSGSGGLGSGVGGSMVSVVGGVGVSGVSGGVGSVGGGGNNGVGGGNGAVNHHGHGHGHGGGTAATGSSNVVGLGSGAVPGLGNVTGGGRVHSSGKDVIFRAYEDSRTVELLVGDVDGFVSRWAPTKLEQLSQRELQSLCK